MENGNVKKKNKLTLKVTSILLVLTFVFGGALAYSAYKDKDFTDSTVQTQQAISSNLEHQFQNEVNDFLEELVNYTKTVYEPILLSQVTNSNRDSLTTLSNEFSYVLNEFEPAPLTDKDGQFEDHVFELKFQSERLVDYATKFINKPNPTDKSMFLDAYNELSITIGRIAQLEDKLYN